jgi:hypothetical protein
VTLVRDTRSGPPRQYITASYTSGSLRTVTFRALSIRWLRETPQRALRSGIFRHSSGGQCVGAGVWASPALDTTNGILYVGTGNPGSICSPSTPNATRYPDSILALKMSSGQLLNYDQASSRVGCGTLSLVTNGLQAPWRPFLLASTLRSSLDRDESSRNLIKCWDTDGLPCLTWLRTCQQRPTAV